MMMHGLANVKSSSNVYPCSRFPSKRKLYLYRKQL